MNKLITDEVFLAFLKCETKAHLKLSHANESQCEYNAWQRQLMEDYRRECSITLRSHIRADECLTGVSLPPDLKKGKYHLVLGCLAHAPGMQSRLHALERLPLRGKTKHHSYIPVRFVPSEKVTLHDKLLLAFDALVLATASGKMPLFGKIVHGREQKTVRVQLAGLVKTARSVVEKIAAQQENGKAPQLILNKHCAECEYQPRCRQMAIEKDELSLLPNMSGKERKKQHEKGIFTITQLSYTFRPRRKPKRASSRTKKYYHALKALAIRERKLHIAGKPELHLTGTPVYLDVEGDPGRNFYYLIGLRIGPGDVRAQHSFWANDESEEKEIWTSFLRTLAQIENPQLIHYGSYETVFLKRMKERYCESPEASLVIDQLLAEAVNLLSIIYAQIYFPTYSNSLKEIARHLGFQWSESDASGLKALVWRSEWEVSGDARLKQKLITYNAEDCEAVERIADAIVRLCRRQTETITARDDNVIYADSLKREYPQRFGEMTFACPEFEYINKAAYWDYQREKIYLRTSPRLRRVSRKSTNCRAKSLPVNKIIECQPLSFCPQCNSAQILKHRRRTKIVYDLTFGQTSIRRMVIRYLFHQYSCVSCGVTFYSPNRPLTGEKYGPNILAYMIYQIIDLQIPQRALTKSLNLLFHFRLERTVISRQKVRAAQIYKDTYAGILKKIVSGKLIHVDETRVSVQGRSACVWVFTNLEEVAYLYTETREGDFLQEMLQGFQGVLVSDFYTAYDALNCPQQKCLIHLMRDLNNDLLKQPYNEEMKEMVREFAGLLRPTPQALQCRKTLAARLSGQARPGHSP